MSNKPHDNHAQQRLNARTRALLGVFDTPAPPDFYTRVLARADAAQPCQQQPRGWVRQVWQKWELRLWMRALYLRPGLWRPVGVGAVCCLLATGMSLYLGLSGRETRLSLPQVSMLPPGEAARRDARTARCTGPEPVERGESSGTPDTPAAAAETRPSSHDTAPVSADTMMSSNAQLAATFVPAVPERSRQRRRGGRGHLPRPPRDTTAPQYPRT